MARSLLTVAFCLYLAAFAFATSESEFEVESVDFESELEAMEAAGLANEIRAAAQQKMIAKFEAEARAFHELTSGSASASGAEGPGQDYGIDLSAPVEASADTKRKVSAFCHNPVAEKMGITYHGYENPLAEATASRVDMTLDCLGAIADWLSNMDTPSKFVTAMPSTIVACVTGISSAEIMIRIKRYADDPTNRHAAKMLKLVDFFKEHPLVQFAFIEAISLTVDLATCGGDFTTVALKHAVTITGEIVKAKWQTLVNAMKALKRQWTRAMNSVAVKQARAAIYDWVYEHSPPMVRAAIGALHDANAADVVYNDIKKQLFELPAGKEYVAARNDFAGKAVEMVVQYVSFGANLAITAAGAPTGVGAVMAGVGTSLAAGKCVFKTVQAAKAYCKMDAAWEVCLTTPTGKRLLEAEAVATKYWREARASSLDAFKEVTGIDLRKVGHTVAGAWGSAGAGHSDLKFPQGLASTVGQTQYHHSSVANVGPNAAFGGYRPLNTDAAMHWGAVSTATTAFAHHEETPLPPTFTGFQG